MADPMARLERLCSHLLRQCFDPVALKLARRGETLLAQQRMGQQPVCARIHESAVTYPEFWLDNLSDDPSKIIIGAGSHVRGRLQTFSQTASISIGTQCYVGDLTRIWAQSSISIGDYVLIAHLVDINDSDSHPIDHLQRREDEKIIFDGLPRDLSRIRSAPIVIEDDAWIGAKATVLKGVRIGRGAIVAAGSVVTKNVPPWTVVAGNPASVRREILDHDRG